MAGWGAAGGKRYMVRCLVLTIKPPASLHRRFCHPILRELWSIGLQFTSPNDSFPMHLFFLWLGLTFLAPHARGTEDPLESAPIPAGVSRAWVGPEFFANRLADWRLEGGGVHCLEAGRRRGLRTLHWLTRSVLPGPGQLRLEVVVDSPLEHGWHEGAMAGFLVGAGGEHVDPRLTAMVHSLPAEDGGLLAVIERDGRVSLRNNSHSSGKGGSWAVAVEVTQEMVPMLSGCERTGEGFGAQGPGPLKLELSLEGDGRDWNVDLRAVSLVDGRMISRAHLRNVEADLVEGCVALVSQRGSLGSSGGFSFQDWRGGGNRLGHHPERAFGPVMAALYTVHASELRMTAQMGVLGEDDVRRARLRVRPAHPRGIEDGEWLTVAYGDYVPGASTCTFVVPEWDGTRDFEYSIGYDLATGDGENRMTEYPGVIPAEPLHQDHLSIAAFTGHKCYTGGLKWNSNGFWFPHSDISSAVQAHDPDLLFFSGDQVYEGDFDPAAGLKEERAFQDYLYKWWRWCWAFGDLTRNRPSVVIPDDHDVYHGNVWGAGGVAGEPNSPKFYPADRGGYLRPATFVNAVHRTQTSHLPAPFDPLRLPGGITPYHTVLNYGGLSMAILADRMWKSAPAVILTEGDCKNGWFQDPEFDPVTQADVPGAQLLGPSQERMLEQWAGDWSGGVWMKAVLSQTIFANVATLPTTASSDGVTGSLLVQPAGAYAQGEAPVADADSNGWPQTPRDRALRSIRKGFAVHIAGDQHLGSTIHYGVDAFEDSGLALCVPSVANTFPRRWYPPEPGEGRLEGAPAYTGRFLDGFGNHMTVHAVSNPHTTGIAPEGLHDRAPGYGIVRFDRATHRVTLECWPRWADPKSEESGQYPGWPISFDQREGYGRTAQSWLPEVHVHGPDSPVFRLRDARSGELIWALRPGGSVLRPWAFSDAPVDLEVGEQGTAAWVVICDLVPTDNPDPEPMHVYLR